MTAKHPTGDDEAAQRHSTPIPPVTLEVQDVVIPVAAETPAQAPDADPPVPITHWANMPKESTDARVNDPNNPPSTPRNG